MSDSSRHDAEQLIEIHKARDEWEGNLLVGYLRDNGVTASFRGSDAVNLDTAHILKSTDEVLGVFTLESDAAKARELVQEFVSTATDDAMLEESAAQRLRVDKETITRLRGDLKDERETFEFLGLLGVIFLGSAAAVWAIWPAWLRMETPPGLFRWMMVLLFALGAVFAGTWSRRRL
jgi:hypothetical protein